MALVSGTGSGLNPKAEPFIPMSYRQVEDFSPAWWELVKASSWYRDYWLSQHGDDDFGTNDCDDAFDHDDDDMAPEIFDDEFMLVGELDGVDMGENGGSDPMGVGEEERKLHDGVQMEIMRFCKTTLNCCMKDFCRSFQKLKPLDEGVVSHLNTLTEAEALLKHLSMPKSPKNRAPQSPAMGSPKFCNKSVKNVSVKCAPRRIHQPR